MVSTWAYLPGGRVSHALRESGAVSALCGLSVWRPEDWYGTGSQVEYENAAARPKCKRCLARMVR